MTGPQLLIVDNCNGCGACCQHMNTPPFYSHVEEECPEELWAEILSYLDSPEWSDEDKPCLWYDAETRSCKHYEHRPTVCRDFIMGSGDCHASRLARGVDTGKRGECPLCGQVFSVVGAPQTYSPGGQLIVSDFYYAYHKKPDGSWCASNGVKLVHHARYDNG